MKVIDVSELSTFAFGRRAPMWWATVLTMAIEGTAFFLLAASFLYLRGNYELWPPSGVRTPEIPLAFVQLGALLASVLPARYAYRAALAGRLPPMRNGLLVTLVLGSAMLVLRGFELDALPFRWDSHAYGSAFWAMLILQTLHAATALMEIALLIAILFRGPVEKRHQPDVELAVIGWYFVVAAWLPGFALLYSERIWSF